MRISDVVRISDGYADFLSVGIRISYRWVPRNRVGAFILRSEDRTANGLWSSSRVKQTYWASVRSALRSVDGSFVYARVVYGHIATYVFL